MPGTLIGPVVAPKVLAVHKLATLALLFGLGGCAMAGPGIARGTPSGPGDQQRATTYNSQWVSKPVSEIDSLDTMQANAQATDISKRQLGQNYTDPDIASGKYTSVADKIVSERVNARQNDWKARMGIKNVNDEQAPKK